MPAQRTFTSGGAAQSIEAETSHQFGVFDRFQLARFVCVCGLFERGAIPVIIKPSRRFWTNLDHSRLTCLQT